MSHFYAISDIHAHPYATGTQKGNNGAINFRLQNCLDSLEMACRAASQDEAPLFIAGDFAHLKAETPQLVTDLLFDLFSRYPNTRIYGIAGNHDFLNKDGSRTILGVLRDKITVFPEPRRMILEDQRMILTAVPFIRDIDVLRSTISQLVTPPTPGFTRVLLAHAYTQELMLKHAGLTTNDLSASFFAMNFDLVLLGHHHVHDVLEYPRPDGSISKVVSIGAPLQLTFADRGQEKGYLKIELPSMTIKQIETNMPRFMEIHDPTALKPADVKNAFVRVKVSGGADLKKLQKKLETTEALKISFEHVPEKKQQRITGLKASMPDEEIFRKYIEGNAPPAGLDAHKLLKLSAKYMSV